MRAMSIAGRRVLVLTAAALVLAISFGAGAASAGPVTGSAENGSYLALGDSVAFGYRPPASVPTPDYLDPHSFVGYPEFLAQQLDEHVANAGCPGETSSSLLVAGAPSNGCENSPGSPVGYRTLFPLHVGYDGTQIDYATHYLAAHRHTQLVTLDVGANDFFLCQETTADGCTSLGELLAVANQLSANLATTLHDLRAAGYQGPIVVLTYYSLSYTDPAALQSAEFLDQTIAAAATANGGIVADGFGAFEGPALAAGGSSCAAGLLIPLPTGGCDVHPTAAGARLLAGAIAEAIGA
jgi:lysophospholipase L1-like esterase